MRSYAASVALAGLLFLSLAAAQGGDFPKLSTIVIGTTTSANPAEKTSDSSGTTSPNGATPVGGNGAAPSFPPPTIPPTAAAPFMQKSTLPQGTVFICVGAVLGFLLACVLAWRGFLMWTVQRNIRRGNKGYAGLTPQWQQPAKKMGAGIFNGTIGVLRKKKNAPFYGAKIADDSAMSLNHLTAAPKGRSTSGNAPLASAPSKSSLFFSPTASAAGGAGAGMPAANLGVKRGEGYLPAGYYAGTGQSGSGGADRSSRHLSTTDFDGRSQLGMDGGSAAGRGSTSRLDLRDSRRDSQMRLVSNDSRRDSSYGSAPRLGLAANQSNLSLGSGLGEGTRAPSAYLEDLFSTPPVPQQEHYQ